MKKYFFILLILFIYSTLFLLLMLTPAYAYLDPGTGSYFIQFIIAFSLGCLLMIKLFWLKIKCFFLNLLKKKSKNDTSSPAQKSQ